MASLIGLIGVVEVTSGIALGMAVARWRARSGDTLVPLFIFAAVAIEVVLKLVVVHPAPPDDHVRTIALLPTVHLPLANSFPSGHVLRTTFLVAIARGVPAWIGPALVVLMIASRVYLAEHWLSDCIGGLVLGLVTAGIAYAVLGGRGTGEPAWTARPGAQRRR